MMDSIDEIEVDDPDELIPTIEMLAEIFGTLLEVSLTLCNNNRGHIYPWRGEQWSSGKTSVSGGKAPEFDSRLPQMPSLQNTERGKHSSGLWFCISSVIQRVIVGH